MGVAGGLGGRHHRIRAAVQAVTPTAAVNNHHIIVAAEVSQDAGDGGLFQPMVAATRAALDTAGVADS